MRQPNSSTGYNKKKSLKHIFMKEYSCFEMRVPYFSKNILN